MRFQIQGGDDVMSTVKEINCIYIPTTDTEVSAQWYVHNLGLELMRPVHENQAQLRIPSGQAIFLKLDVINFHDDSS